MSDDLTKTGTQDRIHIDDEEAGEVRYWCKEFVITEERLKELIAKHGPVAKDIWAVLD